MNVAQVSYSTCNNQLVSPHFMRVGPHSPSASSTMSTKVVPVMSEEEAATKMQAMQRGNSAREATKPSMERKLTQNFTVPDNGQPKKKSWALVRQKTELRFDNWDMALKVIDAGWRGALEREVLPTCPQAHRRHAHARTQAQ